MCLRQVVAAARRKKLAAFVAKREAAEILRKAPYRKGSLHVFRPLGWPAGHLGGPPTLFIPSVWGCSHPLRKVTTTPVLVIDEVLITQ